MFDNNFKHNITFYKDKNEAQSILARATAEAEGLKKLADSLTGEGGKNKAYKLSVSTDVEITRMVPRHDPVEVVWRLFAGRLRQFGFGLPSRTNGGGACAPCVRTMCSSAS